MFLARSASRQSLNPVMPYFWQSPIAIVPVHEKSNLFSLTEVGIHIRSIARFCAPLKIVATTSSPYC